MKRLYIITIVISALLLFSGCTHYYVPVVYPLKDGMAPAFAGDNNIMLINENPEGELFTHLGNLGPYKWYGDLKRWTNTASSLIRIELEDRGFEISDRNPKVLKLSIHRASVHQTNFQFRAIVYLIVETGDGYKHEYVGNNASGWSLYRASNGAITRAVGAMLSDKKIITYVTEKECPEISYITTK